MKGLSKIIKNKLRGRVLRKLRLARVGRSKELWGKALILNQCAYSKKPGTFGSFGNLYANGCGLAAINNANCILGRDVSFTKTYLEFHTKGFFNVLLGGFLGTAPSSIYNYFTKAGFKVSRYKSFEHLNKTHNAYIIMYIWKKGKKIGAHYAAMEFVADSNLFKVYNDGIPIKYYADLSDMIKEDGIIAYKIFAIDK